MHNVPIEDTIDLHSFLPREIPIVVEEYLYQAARKGLERICLIHGRGAGVQRRIVQSILARHEDVVSFHDADDRGSTYVVLKRRPV
jgi:DNA-nicking Smr family endonuclease